MRRGRRAPLLLTPCTHSRDPLAGGLERVSTTRLFSRSMGLLLPAMEGFRCTCTLPLAVSSRLHTLLQTSGEKESHTHSEGHVTQALHASYTCEVGPNRIEA